MPSAHSPFGTAPRAHSDAQSRLERALRMGDTHAAQRALAAGADPNARDARGLPPLGQLWHSSWATKLSRRWSDGDADRDSEKQASFERAWVRQRERLTDLLGRAGAVSEVAWIWPPVKSSETPADPTPLQVQAPEEGEGEEKSPVVSPPQRETFLNRLISYEVYRYDPDSPWGYGAADVSASVDRLRPWIVACADWSGLNAPLGGVPKSSSQVALPAKGRTLDTLWDDLVTWFYMIDNEPNWDGLNLAVHTMLWQVWELAAAHHPDLAQTWLAQWKAYDPATPLLFGRSVGEVEGCLRAQARHRELDQMPLVAQTSSASPRRLRG